MKNLNSKTLECLRNIINEKLEYRSGPNLVGFFNDLGSDDDYGEGFPSRWMYTDSKLAEINNADFVLEECIKKVFNPINFINREKTLSDLILEFNKYLSFDGYHIRNKGKEIEIITEEAFLKDEEEKEQAYWEAMEEDSLQDRMIAEGIAKSAEGVLSSPNEDKVLLWLSYTENRELLLNDVILITKTRHNSINDRLLRYLFDNQGRRIDRNEFNEKGVLKVAEKEDKDFYVFLDDIKMKTDLRKLFFSKDLSKHSLHLTNQITENDMKNYNINFIDIKQIFKN